MTTPEFWTLFVLIMVPWVLVILAGVVTLWDWPG